ncbi:hypothetical protein ACMG4P_22060 [Pseudovibrio denitrificans]|uniref:hypothetical protein n=1 Tax=Pseudovibrio denitrificans TaxID=258256 RepID=UPI0039BF096B
MAKKTDNELAESSKPKAKECFAIMPISDVEGYETGHFKRVYEDLITPACIGAGFTPRIASDVKETNLIQLDILKRLLDAPMAICDISTHNPNVLFELGIRQAFDKPTVIIQEKGTKGIFDISSIRYTEYDKRMGYRDVLDGQKAITEALQATANPEGGSVNSIVNLLALAGPAEIPQLDGQQRANAEIDLLRADVQDMKSMLRTLQRNIGGSNSNTNSSSSKSRILAELLANRIARPPLQEYYFPRNVDEKTFKNFLGELAMEHGAENVEVKEGSDGQRIIHAFEAKKE